MGISAKIWCPFNSKHHLREVPVPNVDCTTMELKSHIRDLTNLPMESLAVISEGRRFPDSAILATSVRGCENSDRSLFVVVLETRSPIIRESLRDQTNAKPTASAAGTYSTAEHVASLVNRWKSILSDHVQRTLLFKILSNQGTIATLITTTPGLRDDVIAQRLLGDTYLLLYWLTADNVQTILQEHSSLIDAAEQILLHLHLEASRLAVNPGAIYDAIDAEQATMAQRGVGFEADDASSGDEAAGNDRRQAYAPPVAERAPATATDRRARGSNNANSHITTGHLAEALAAAAAAGSPVTGAAPSRNASMAINRQRSTGAITAEMFNRALGSAFGGNEPRAASSLSNADLATGSVHQPRDSGALPINAESVAQLESMGFTDPDEINRALIHSNGNVELALEYIVNERERRDREMALD